MNEFGNYPRFDTTINLIETFRNFFQDKGMKEEKRESLISHHDLTIRFTNSTTSVLKPFLIRNSTPQNGIFLLQQAMGQQGFNHWLSTAEIGHFTSYFISMGTLCPAQKLLETCQYGYDFLSNILGVSMQRLFIRGFEKDIDIKNTIQHFPNFLIEKFDERPYRHSFGIKKLVGRNANFSIKNNDVLYDIGNVIVIEYKNKVVGIELSFDTTLLISAIENLSNPIYAYPYIDIWRSFNIPLQNIKNLVCLDAFQTAIPLLLEGLKPNSRGRGGNLKKILNIFNQCYPTEFKDILHTLFQSCAKQEIELKKHLSPFKNGFEVNDFSQAELNFRSFQCK